MYERLELYIESLTGAAFELRVSPYETIQDIKARIQKLEGIPISQQHLIWQAAELEDDCCLSDYSIQDGATLKLVLTMRGGPINTRRIPMDDPSLREMAEYLSEASKDELTERVTNRPVTVIVYHNGDQFNFFRLVDQDSTSPLPESLCGASVYNLYDDEEEEEEEDVEEGAVGEDKSKENDKMREKMKLLRSKMETMTITKQQNVKKTVPHPPSSGCPSGKMRLRRLTSHSASGKSTSLNKNKRLPPVGGAQTEPEQTATTAGAGELGTLQAAKDLFHSATAAASGTEKNNSVSPLGIRRLDSLESTKLKSGLCRVVEDHVLSESHKDDSQPSAKLSTEPNKANCDKNVTSATSKAVAKETLLRRAQSSLKASPKWEFSPEVLLKDAGRKSPASPGCGEMQLGASPEAVAVQQDSGPVKGFERLLDNSDIDGPSPTRTLPPGQIKGGLASHKELHSRIPSTRHSIERLQSGGVILESLHPSEVRAMSGMLSNLVRSASKSRAGITLSGGGSYKDPSRIPTPDGRLMSSRLQRLSASREHSHRLPPVKQKKKSKRCFVCGKKTGLTNSYACRCSNNFCATHRYPEAHNCTFDYKTEGRKLLEQNNPVISAPKLPKI